MSKMRGYCATFLQRFGARIAVGVHNKALSVVAMRVCNPDRSPIRINR
jgi:hypothetical protein